MSKIKSGKKDLLAEKLSFLSSTRFWKLVIIAALESLVITGAIDGATAEAITHLVSAVLGGSVAIRTVDRFAEHVGKK